MVHGFRRLVAGPRMRKSPPTLLSPRRLSANGRPSRIIEIAHGWGVSALSRRSISLTFTRGPADHQGYLFWLSTAAPTFSAAGSHFRVIGSHRMALGADLWGFPCRQRLSGLGQRPRHHNPYEIRCSGLQRCVRASAGRIAGRSYKNHGASVGFIEAAVLANVMSVPTCPAGEGADMDELLCSVQTLRQPNGNWKAVWPTRSRWTRLSRALKGCSLRQDAF